MSKKLSLSYTSMETLQNESNLIDNDTEVCMETSSLTISSNHCSNENKDDDENKSIDNDNDDDDDLIFEKIEYNNEDNLAVASSFQMLIEAPLLNNCNSDNKNHLETPKTPLSTLGKTPPPGESLKRSLNSVSSDIENNSSPTFIIKKRRILSNRSFSLDDSDVELGASPNLIGYKNEESVFTPKRFPFRGVNNGHELNLTNTPKMKKSFSSINAADIKKSCHIADTIPDMTGSFDKKLSLPVMKTGTRHPELNTIDCHTLANLINGSFNDRVASFRIIDARYVYEYQGGHIKGAVNFGKWDEDAFWEEFIPNHLPPVEFNCQNKENDDQSNNDEKRQGILIFHCEFSAHRGPGLMRLLRQKDRLLNKDTYPALYYPECYLLHKGYKEFYANYPELCEPCSYQPMSDPKFSNEEKMFRKKSKTWTGNGTVTKTGTFSRFKRHF